MTEQQFKELLEKYERGTATAYEARQVEEFFKSYVDEALDEGLPVMGSVEDRKSELLNRISRPSRRMMTPKRSSAVWWAAAASIMVAIACFLFVYPWQQEPISKTVAEAEIVPGSDKAILQLSDNSIVTLDSANQQRILQQGASLVTGGGGKLVYNKQDESAEPVYNKVITPRGGQYELVLSDGTRVWLNASSSLRFPVAFVGNERVVELTGEAYFEVAKDADRIFRVIAPNQDVEVLGTSFNVMAYADEPMIKTSLIEGVVNIIPASGKEVVRLNPGQQSQLDPEGNLHVVAGGAIIDQAVAWRFGMFQFDNTEMKVVMRQVSRWYDVDVAYEEGVEDLELVGVVSRKSSLSSVLRVMELTGAVHFEVRPDVIIVKPGRKPGT